MMRLPGMNIMRGALLAASTLLVFACGRNETMASKSAAAYREAQAKGNPVAGGHEHGGHEAAAASTATDTMDHSAHGTGAGPHAGHDMTAAAAADHGTHGTADHAGHGAMSAADHAAMGHGAGGDAHAGHTATRGGGMDHSAHGSTPGTAAPHDQHAGMQHGTPATPADPHAQHRQPATATGHAGHGAAQQTNADAPRVVLSAPTTNAGIARTQPAATLQPDDFDTPAPIAVEEANKAAGGSQTDPHAGHGTKEH